ncbi:extracellular solute-binding protein [Oerskovia sp. M15]
MLPLSDYEEYMPNFQKYIEEWDLRPMVDNLRQADGKYYMMPGLQEVSVPTFSLVLRQDVLDDVGAPVPETWDDLRDGLEKIKAKYPDSYPLADGFEGQSMLNYAAHAFGATAGWGFGDGTFYDEDAEEFVYGATSDGYRAMVEYFHGLVEDGLLDPESFTATNDGASTVTEKVANGKVFVASGAAGTVQEFSTALDATAGKGNYEVVQIAPPAGLPGRSSSRATSGTASWSRRRPRTTRTSSPSCSSWTGSTTAPTRARCFVGESRRDVHHVR